MIDVDLPSLQSIKLGKGSLGGRDGDSYSLTMRSNNEIEWNDWIDLPKLKTIESEEYSFYWPRWLTLESSSESRIRIKLRHSKSR